MDNLLPENLLTVLAISATFSIFLMAFIQKIKDLSIITKSWQVWLLNLVCSFLLGIPFGINFYGLNIYLSIWVAIFGFIGAPTLYEALKTQNLINYTPKSSSDNIETPSIDTSSEIKRSI